MEKKSENIPDQVWTRNLPHRFTNRALHSVQGHFLDEWQGGFTQFKKRKWRSL